VCGSAPTGSTALSYLQGSTADRSPRVRPASTAIPTTRCRSKRRPGPTTPGTRRYWWPSCCRSLRQRWVATRRARSPSTRGRPAKSCPDTPGRREASGTRSVPTAHARICREPSGCAGEVKCPPMPMSDPAGRSDPRPDHGSPDLPVQSFFAADASTQTIPLLPSWSAITVCEGASLSLTTVPPAATAAAIRCSATSGAT
jgi:hypothetical protein